MRVSGPSKATSSDLWHMAWQLNSSRIVMLANLTEDGRVSVVHDSKYTTVSLTVSIERLVMQRHYVRELHFWDSAVYWVCVCVCMCVKYMMFQ